MSLKHTQIIDWYNIIDIIDCYDTFMIKDYPDGEVEERVLIFSCKNSKITTHCWTIINRRMLDPTKKDTHIPGQRRSPSKMVGGTKSHLESNPIPARDVWRAQTKPCVFQDPETPQRLSQTYVWLFSGGTGQQWPAVGKGALGTTTWVTQPVA